MAISVYIDESGNSGRDIYDLQQPLLTYAGVWLTPTEATAAQAELDRLIDLHRLQRQGELKGKSILNPNSGRQVVRDLLRWFKDQKIAVTVIALEKTSMAANVLVEDCTDPAYNDAYDDRWTWDTRLKEPLGERIAREAPRDLLEAAWRARHDVDKAAFEKAYASLLFALTLSGDSLLASEAKRLHRVNLNEVWSASELSRGTNGGYSPNLSVFTSLLMNAERMAEKRNLTDVEVVHDNQRQYRAVFEQWWTAIRGNGVDQERFELPNKNEVILGLKRLIALRFEDSTTSIGIQLADFVASAVRVALQEKMSNIPNRSRTYLADLQALTRSQVSWNSPFVIGSESWQLLAMTHLLGVDPRRMR